MSNTAEKLHTLIDQLSPQDQQQVLEIIEELAQSHQHSPLSKLPPGTSGKDLLALEFSMSPEDVDAMEKAIEEGCERIEPDEDQLFA